MTSTIALLKDHFKSPNLPGWSAQRRMSVRQDEHLRLKVPSSARHAAVLALIHNETAPVVYLIERQHHQHDRHSGQLSFPGGKVEPDDESLLHTALREAREEIGLNEDDVEVIGELSSLYIPVSNFLVHPFVAYSEADLNLKAEEAEVASILKLHLASLLTDPPNTTDMHLPNGLKLTNVPYYPLANHQVWGATAMILSELGYILQSNPKFAKIVDPN